MIKTKTFSFFRGSTADWLELSLPCEVPGQERAPKIKVRTRLRLSRKKQRKTDKKYSKHTNARRDEKGGKDEKDRKYKTATKDTISYI